MQQPVVQRPETADSSAAVAWNGAGTGTRLTATVGSVSSWRLGDGIPTARDWASAGETCSGTEFRIEGVMVHEVGHLLGLGHSSVSGATMYPSVSACNNGPATIEADDRAGINDLY